MNEINPDTTHATDTDSSQEQEDSDDYSLLLPPSALLQDSSALRSDVRRTKSTDVFVESRGSLNRQATNVSSKKLIYSLDVIVQSNNTQDVKDAMLGDLHKSLRNEIDDGGITKVIEEEERQQELQTEQGGTSNLDSGHQSTKTDLLPEHEDALQQYALKTERIAPLHPGEDVFCNDDIGKLFSYPGRLSLKDFGFISTGENAMEQLLLTSTPDELEELIMSRFFVDVYLVKQCPNSVMLWLLHLMSIHDKAMIADVIFDIMWSLMESLPQVHPNSKPWFPILSDIVRIFVNYGANLKILSPPFLLQMQFTEEDLRSSQDQRNSQQPCSQTQVRGFPVLNLIQVMKLITQCLLAHNRGSCYSEEDLLSLTYIVCKVSLEKQLVGYPVQFDFTRCIAAILRCFHEDTWAVQANKICWILSKCSAHHHNLVYLVRLMPTETCRGRFLRRMLSYVFLDKLTSECNDKQQELKDFGELKVSDLLSLLASAKSSNTFTCRSEIDYYQLHSRITLVELAVGNVIKPSDKEALGCLASSLRDMAGDIRENHKHLCRTQVKDLMIRTASNISYLKQNSAIKQTFLHTS